MGLTGLHIQPRLAVGDVSARQAVPGETGDASPHCEEDAEIEKLGQEADRLQAEIQELTGKR
jgi:hypothetical protein